MGVRCLSSSVVSRQEVKKLNLWFFRNKVISFKFILVSLVHTVPNNRQCECRSTKILRNKQCDNGSKLSEVRYSTVTVTHSLPHSIISITYEASPPYKKQWPQKVVVPCLYLHATAFLLCTDSRADSCEEYLPDKPPVTINSLNSLSVGVFL